ncbi:MAG: hypothetical protein ACLS3M_01200 [Collinsella sp.]
MMADDRAIVDEAYAGDIVGLFDPGIFSIGDTVCSGKRHVQYPQIPTFAPRCSLALRRSTRSSASSSSRAWRSLPGGRHPDLPRAGCRHGERHRGRGRRAAV